MVQDALRHHRGKFTSAQWKSPLVGLRCTNLMEKFGIGRELLIHAPKGPLTRRFLSNRFTSALRRKSLDVSYRHRIV